MCVRVLTSRKFIASPRLLVRISCVRRAVWLSHESNVDTAAFCEYLSAHDLVSNVETDDVEAVTWDDLKGVEDVVRELEAKIALPFEHRELAAELNLKPKRGVLLAGSAGDGEDDDWPGRWRIG
ncbi:MAG: hypothetical protein WDO18_17190 [Acidobacteriota bacterium]